MWASMEKYLELGKIINKHGYKGTVKLEPWCDTPKVAASVKTVYLMQRGEYTALPVLSASVQKQFVLMTLSGIDSEEKADRLRGAVLYADRRDLPLAEGAHFIADLIGLPVRDADNGITYGTLSDVYENAGRELYQVKTPKGMVLIPAVPAFIVSADPEKEILIRPIPGMFDED